MRNILMISVPHSGSTVISHMASLIGGQHHGDPATDWGGWRRGEQKWFNAIAYQMMRARYSGLPESVFENQQPDRPLPTLQDEMRDGLKSLKPGWIVKSIHWPMMHSVAQQAVLDSETDPLLVWVHRDVKKVAVSFKTRGQYKDSTAVVQEPGIWGFNVGEMWLGCDEAYNAWPGNKAIFNFDQLVSFGLEYFSRASEMFRIFGPLEDKKRPTKRLADLWDAVSIFDPIRTDSDNHPKKGSSGWGARDVPPKPEA